MILLLAWMLILSPASGLPRAALLVHVMTLLTHAQAEIAAICTAVPQPQLNAAASAADEAAAAVYRDRLTCVLRACPESLDSTSSHDLLKLRLVMGDRDMPVDLGVRNSQLLVRRLRAAAGSDMGAGDNADPANPKWASGAEGVADIVTALGPSSRCSP